MSLVSGQTAEIKLLPGSRISDLKEQLRKVWPKYKDDSLNLFVPDSSTKLHETEIIQCAETPLHFLLVAGEATTVPVDEIIAAINKSCQDAGGIYARYNCKAISWDDCARSAGPNGVSCSGPNITDSRLVERSGQTLYTVRGANWNERLGKVSADDVAVLVTEKDKEPKAVSLRQYLREIHRYGAYAGIPADISLHADADDAISIRFQTTFLPAAEDGTLEFCGEAYNYQTVSNEDPKNLVLLCTSEGTALQQQGAGYQKLFLHEAEDKRHIARRWLEAKATGHKVGGAQEESWEAAAESEHAAMEARQVLQERLELLTEQAAQLEAQATERKLRAAEAEEAAKDGRAVARRFGIDAMGSRCNMLMTIQVPLQQKKPSYTPMPAQVGFAGDVCGIDFGTTNCRVALWQNGGATVLPNAQGNINTPCCVAVQDGKLLVGEAAKWSNARPENFVCGPKRFLGRRWSELVAKQGCLEAPFKEGKDDDRPLISLPCGPQGKEKCFESEELAKVILQDVKQVVSEHLGGANTKLGCVLTVPAHANDAQRQATKSAAEAAGFQVLRIINEPTAAAIAHGLAQGAVERKVLVVDMGAGMTDVSVLSIEDGIFEILATNGAQLGGSDFDEALMGYVNASKNPRVRQLREACEAAKRRLSFLHETQIELDLGEDEEITRISRASFEKLIWPILQKVKQLVESTLQDGNVGKNEIHDVLLVGGSANVPKLRQMLTEFFGKEPCNAVNSECAVVEGAAYQAAILSGANNNSVMDLLLLDVTPLSIGFESANGAMTRVIERNTTIPTKRTVTLTTHSDFQPSVKLRIFEGQASFCQENHFLGDFDIDNLPPMPKGCPQIEVTFDIDANGILRVSAIEKSTGKSSALTITNDKGTLSKEQIDQMIQEEDGQLQGTNELPESGPVKAYGASYAARVSRGRVHDYWTGLTIDPRRDETQHCTITVQFYHTVVGGVPSPQDIMAAIDDLESLFQHCEWHGQLDESGADFMKD